MTMVISSYCALCSDEPLDAVPHRADVRRILSFLLPGMQ